MALARRLTMRATALSDRRPCVHPINNVERRANGPLVMRAASSQAWTERTGHVPSDDVERDQLSAPQGAGEAKQQQGPIAAPDP
jgi:hypothetical protein